MSQTRALPFLKIVGTGNDFLFVDLRDEKLESYTKLSRPHVVSRLAHRNCGAGADGVVFIERKQEDAVPLRWDFYNADGSTAEMCGNALRCMGRWGLEVLGQDEIRFETARGPVHVLREADTFRAELDFLHLDPREIRATVRGRAYQGLLVNTGVPHVVVEETPIPSSEQARKDAIEGFRFHDDAGPRGANVTFLERVSPGEFKTVSFERGVEGYTLSCGTGVLAAAAVGLGIHHSRPPQTAVEARMKTPGGALRVSFAPALKSIALIGPAEIVFAGQTGKGFLK